MYFGYSDAIINSIAAGLSPGQPEASMGGDDGQPGPSGDQQPQGMGMLCTDSHCFITALACMKMFQ